jgi:hypothetical protein
MQTTTPCTKFGVAKKLAEFWLPHLIKSEDIFTHLEYADSSSKEIRQEALRLELIAFDDLLAADVPADWRFKEYRRRTIITLAGKITYLRRIYIEPSGITHAYLDEILGIRTRMKLAPDAFLWIVKTAADISFRKTARAFYERTGAKISHWLVMACVHEEGALILEEAYREAFGDGRKKSTDLPYSSETLFVEFDGIHIPLQKNFHGPKKVRWVYEQDRKKNSFELKVASFYAGKDKKRRRLGLEHFALDAAPAYFWPLLNARIASTYDIEVIEAVHSSADAAGWCKGNELDVIATANEAYHYLDRFHLNRECRRAFGGKTARATHFIKLAYKKKVKRMLRDVQLVINKAKGKDKERYLKFLTYLQENRKLIERGAGPSMGTMEGTNAHVYAARMKVWGGAWSRHGGTYMAVVRARIASGRKLICPTPDNVLYDDHEIARRTRFEEKGLLQKTYHIRSHEGKGYEPPRGVVPLTTHMAPYLYGVLNYT